MVTLYPVMSYWLYSGGNPTMVTATPLRTFVDHRLLGGRGVPDNMKRRRFIQTLATLPVAASVLKAGTSTDSVEASGIGRTRILPKGLHPGSTIGIVCPASAATVADVKDFVDLCTAWGVKVKMGRNISRRNGYLSAPDKERAAEFMDFIDDPTVDAVVCARGGYGVMRILPMLDFSAIRDAGKIIMGFSDITALLIAVQQLSGVVTFHGPVASSTFNPFTVSSLKTVVVSSDPTPLSFTDKRLTTIRSGLAHGRLTGGNLAMIVSTLGTKYEIDTTDAILFLEEINEEPYRVDRMLTQLWLAGKLQSCKGIALGNFRDCEAKGTSITGPSFTLEQVFEQRIASIGIPVIYGLPVGHVKDKLTMPLGVRAELDATNKHLRLLEPAVAARSGL
ncbi:MAG TPA: LD-carboxypeptidase [Candidatus Didemnitutus sp.]|nr:LD-carboxypeptidase [Candidatus Didemnitutus sp.]